MEDGWALGRTAIGHLEPGALNLCVALPTARIEMDAVQYRVAAGQRIGSNQRQPTVDIAVTTVV